MSFPFLPIPLGRLSSWPFVMTSSGEHQAVLNPCGCPNTVCIFLPQLPRELPGLSGAPVPWPYTTSYPLPRLHSPPPFCSSVSTSVPSQRLGGGTSCPMRPRMPQRPARLLTGTAWKLPLHCWAAGATGSMVLAGGILWYSFSVFSKSFGGKNLKRVGIILQRGILILLLCCFPCWAIFINTENLLLLLRQDPEVARSAVSPFQNPRLRVSDCLGWGCNSGRMLT